VLEACGSLSAGKSIDAPLFQARHDSLTGRTCKQLESSEEILVCPIRTLEVQAKTGAEALRTRTVAVARRFRAALQNQLDIEQNAYTACCRRLAQAGAHPKIA